MISDKICKYSFTKIDGSRVDLEVKNDRSREYIKNYNDSRSCCYVMHNVTDDRTYCFIKYNNGRVYDTFRHDDKTYREMDWKWKKVNTDILLDYLKYIGGLKEFKKFRGKRFLLTQIEQQIAI